MICSRCKLEKPKRAGKHRSLVCRECYNELARVWISKHPEAKKKAHLRAIAWRRANSERTKANNRRSSALRKLKNPAAHDQKKRRDALRKYNLTQEQYQMMLESQNYRCAICDAASPGGGKKHFCVDHHHATGRVRSLLCHRCNLAVGLLESRLRDKLMDYIKPYIGGFDGPNLGIWANN